MLERDIQMDLLSLITKFGLVICSVIFRNYRISSGISGLVDDIMVPVLRTGILARRGDVAHNNRTTSFNLRQLTLGCSIVFVWVPFSNEISKGDDAGIMDQSGSRPFCDRQPERGDS